LGVGGVEGREGNRQTKEKWEPRKRLKTKLTRKPDLCQDFGLKGEEGRGVTRGKFTSIEIQRSEN